MCQATGAGRLPASTRQPSAPTQVRVPASACTWCEGSGVPSEEEAAIPSEGCLLPCICKGNPRMAAFRSPQQGTITEHQMQLKKSGASRHVQVTLERIQHLCSSGCKEQETRRAAMTCLVSLHFVTPLSPKPGDADSSSLCGF